LRLFSFGGYGLALAALALVVFGAIECPPNFTNLKSEPILTIARASLGRKVEICSCGFDFQSREPDAQCINAMAQNKGISPEEMWEQLQEKRFDYDTATYLLLLSRKRRGLPPRLMSAWTSRRVRYQVKHRNDPSLIQRNLVRNT